MTADAVLSNRQRKEAKRARPAKGRAKVGRTVTDSRVVAKAKDVPSDRDGLLWLIGHSRFTWQQERQAKAWRDDYRASAADGAMLKSCLDVRPRGSGTPAGPGGLIADGMDAQARLCRKREVLGNQVDVLELLDGVCGRGLSLRELAGGDGHKAKAYELLLKVALDMLANADVR